MAVASNALTSVASLKRHLRAIRQRQETDFFRVYNDAGSSETSATVEITSSAVVLKTNLLTSTLTFSSNASLSAMVTAIDAVSNWAVVREGDSALLSSDLTIVPATNSLLVANELFFSGEDNLLYEDAIDAASDEVERATGTIFKEDTYRHALDGAGTSKMVLPYKPVTAVLRVGIGKVAGLSAKYTSSSVKHAAVEVTSTSVKLHVDGSVSATLTFASNTTMAAMVTAINAESNWSATLSSATSAWPSSELLIMGPHNALNQRMSLDTMDDADVAYSWDESAGVLIRTDQEPALSEWRGRHLMPFGYTPPRNLWPIGTRNIFVEYTAGFSSTPDDVEQFANELAGNMVRSGRVDGNLASESAAGVSYSATGEGPVSPAIRRRMAKSKRMSRPSFSDV